MVCSMVVYRCRSRYGANHPVDVRDHLMVEGYGIINNVHNWIIVVVTTCPLQIQKGTRVLNWRISNIFYGYYNIL